MANAELVLPDGTQVKIEGTPEEVAKLLETIGQFRHSSASARTREKTSKGRAVKPTKDGLNSLLRELIEEEYFKGSKRSISDIQKKLEERGHIYAITSISPTLTRLTKRKVLRRVKEKKGWMYVT